MSIGLQTILILDDDVDLIRQLARVMTGHYRVAPVSNPTRALAALQSETNIAVFITEQVMRFGNGMDLLEAVRSMKPDIRRVMLTNYSDLASIIPGLHSGTIQALVQKPATDQELLAAVAPQLIQQRSAQGRRLTA